jgi:vacuolar-type H+-ATPase subunit H
MSLEKILDKILEEAQKEARDIVSESRQKAEEIKHNAQKRGEMQAKTLFAQVEREGHLEASRMVTQARLEKRIRILRCKKDLIDQVLDKAFQELEGGKIGVKRKIVRKEGDAEEFLDREKLMKEVRPKLEKHIAEVLKI